MSFPSSTGTRRSVRAAYDDAKNQSFRAKQSAQNIRARAVAGNLGRFEALQYMTTCTDVLQNLTADAAQPGILAWAQQVEADPTLDIAAEFSTMVAAITAVRDWIATNFPVVGGFAQVFQIVSGRYSDPGLTAGALAALLPLLDAVIVSID